MNLIDLEDLLGIHTSTMSSDLSGPCDDDYEVTAPYIGRCPDESDHENGSPLDFRGDQLPSKTKMHENRCKAKRGS